MKAKHIIIQKVFEFTGKYISDKEAEDVAAISFKAGQEEERKKFKDLCAHCDTPLLKEGEQYERIKQEGYKQALRDCGIEITTSDMV